MTNRYSCEPVDRIWTPTANLSRWLEVWQAALTASNHPSGVDPDPVEVSQILDRAAVLEKTMGHDVAAACEAYRDWLGPLDPEAARWLHYGLCSSDVVDAGWLLGIAEVTDELARMVGVVNEALQRSRTNIDILYRTHGQAAQVASDHSRYTGYLAEFIRAAGRMSRVKPSHVGLLGPTGTGGVLDDAARERIVWELGPGLKLRMPSGQQAADRTEWALWLHAVAGLATLAQRVATQIRLGAYEEVGEVTEGRGGGYRASSSMPHKSADGRSNPTRSERICGLAAVIRGLADAYASAAASIWDSHSLEHSSADRLLIPQVTSLTGYVLTELADVLRTLKVDSSRVGSNRDAAQETWGGEDSFVRRNRLIREGATDDTWTAARDGR